MAKARLRKWQRDLQGQADALGLWVNFTWRAGPQWHIHDRATGMKLLTYFPQSSLWTSARDRGSCEDGAAALKVASKMKERMRICETN